MIPASHRFDQSTFSFHVFCNESIPQQKDKEMPLCTFQRAKSIKKGLLQIDYLHPS